MKLNINDYYTAKPSQDMFGIFEEPDGQKQQPGHAHKKLKKFKKYADKTAKTNKVILK